MNLVKHISTLYGHDAQFLNITAGGAYGYHWTQMVV
jgi:hypothetical protein